MPIRFAGGLRRAVRGWHAVAGLVVFLTFAATVLPAQARRTQSAVGPADTPDLMLYYTAADLGRLAEAYGAPGRAEYLRARWGFDLIFPVVYGFFLTTSTAWAFARTSGERSSWNKASLAPLGAVAFDYLENLSTSIVMASYPSPAPLAAALAGGFTFTKWTLVGASVLLLGIGVGRVIRSRIRRRGGPLHR